MLMKLWLQNNCFKTVLTMSCKVSAPFRNQIALLWKLAWPVIITYMASFSLPLITVVMVGHMPDGGTVELAGVALGSMWVYLYTSIFFCNILAVMFSWFGGMWVQSNLFWGSVWVTLWKCTCMGISICFNLRVWQILPRVIAKRKTPKNVAVHVNKRLAWVIAERKN